MRAEEIEEQASLWLAREDRGLTPDGQDALEKWLAGSSRHRVAYLRLKAAWRRADRLAALKRAPMRENSRISGAPRMPGSTGNLGISVEAGGPYARPGGLSTQRANRREECQNAGSSRCRATIYSRA